MVSPPGQEVAIVAIGRNEGERLKSCLRSTATQAGLVVYVDSGSGDGSPGIAASLGCAVVELDGALPFSAARARNEGFRRVMELAPDTDCVQFLDGDCELVEGWLQIGLAALSERSDAAIVFGHVRELHPEASIYNLLSDLEWRQAAGEVRSSGGRFLVRAEAFRAVGGFRPDVIAAEDDEFCVRVRRQGWKILKVDAEMARHDAAMLRFGQWWRRTRRTGHAFAQVSALHGRGEERYFMSDRRKIWIWGMGLPVLGLGLAPFTYGLSLAAMLLAYGLQFARIYGHGRKRGWQAGESRIYALFTVLSRFPALQGLLTYHWRQRRGRALTIIEYKKGSRGA